MSALFPTTVPTSTCRWCGWRIRLVWGVWIDYTDGDGCDDTDADGNPRPPDVNGDFVHEPVESVAGDDEG